ncbi:MAG: hypothetical protein M0R80_07720 [Proteobacteria bacterium]|jgi:hypothetical protein|nr:hypothetical protein [Pseudomonadota bacterium]
MNELFDMLSFIKEKARSNYEDSGHLMPVLFVHTKQGIGIMGIAGDDFVNAKDQVAYYLRQLIAQDDLYEYAFLSEGWAVKVKHKSEIDGWLRDHKSLEGFPGYKEVISLHYASPSKETMASVVIENKTLMLPWEEHEQTPTDAMRAVAQGSCRLSGLWAEHNVQYN